jgi:hypothetical protein
MNIVVASKKISSRLRRVDRDDKGPVLLGELVRQRKWKSDPGKLDVGKVKNVFHGRCSLLGWGPALAVERSKL